MLCVCSLLAKHSEKFFEWQRHCWHLAKNETRNSVKHIKAASFRHWKYCSSVCWSVNWNTVVKTIKEDSDMGRERERRGENENEHVVLRWQILFYWPHFGWNQFFFFSFLIRPSFCSIGSSLIVVAWPFSCEFVPQEKLHLRNSVWFNLVSAQHPSGDRNVWRLSVMKTVSLYLYFIWESVWHLIRMSPEYAGEQRTE